MNNHPSKEYPSPAEVKIYIGEKMWIDDAYRVDWNLVNNRVPLYDYTSKYWKTVAEGNHLVQGQLIINFRYPGYLAKALKDKLIKDSDFSNSLKRQGDITRNMIDADPAERLNILMAARKLGTFEATRQVSDNLFNPDDKPDKVGTESIKTTDSLSHTMDSFNIVIKYGGEEALYHKIIEGCHILGESQVISASALAGGDLSASGMPIFEVYSFLARKVSDRITPKGRLRDNKISIVESTSTSNTFGR